jgi:cytochrome bd ubiquinol oxidase subunit II
MIESLDLPLIWAGILALAVLLYVLLDGFDLGVGILFPFAASDEHRDLMMTTVSPVWDGNETWLVLGGAGLFAAFPTAYAIMMPALYMPVGFMVTALIFRGVAFEFRWRAVGAGRRIWDQAFHWGSVAAAFAQGLMLGTLVQGIAVEDGRFAGGTFDWLTPFSFIVGGALVWGYVLLGATWLIIKTEKDLLEWSRRAAIPAAIVMSVMMVVVAVWMSVLDAPAADRWGSRLTSPDWLRLLLLSPLVGLAVFSFFRLFRALRRDATYAPFLWTATLFLLGFIGLLIGIWPHLIPYAVTFREAAAAPSAQAFLLTGTLFLLPLTLGFTTYVYWTHRGKVTQAHGYH